MVESHSWCMFNFLRNCQTILPKWPRHLVMPSATQESSSCATSSPACGKVSLLNFSHSSSCIVVLICIDLITNVEHHIAFLFFLKKKISTVEKNFNAEINKKSSNKNHLLPYDILSSSDKHIIAFYLFF